MFITVSKMYATDQELYLFYPYSEIKISTINC